MKPTSELLEKSRFPMKVYSADGGIPTGGFAAFQAALLKNDPPDHSSRLRRRSGSNPFMYTKKGYLRHPFFVYADGGIRTPIHC